MPRKLRMTLVLRTSTAWAVSSIYVEKRTTNVGVSASEIAYQKAICVGRQSLRKKNHSFAKHSCSKSYIYTCTVQTLMKIPNYKLNNEKKSTFSNIFIFSFRFFYQLYIYERVSCFDDFVIQ